MPRTSLARRWREASFAALLPVYAALRTSIPFVDPAAYSPRWLTASCAGAPLFAAFYFGTTTLLGWLAAVAVGAAAALAVWYFTLGEDYLPDWEMGGPGGFALGPALFSVAGFFMGVIWIDTIASEVVGIIGLTARVCRVPAGVVGLTLLAWGNSLGDFFGNPAMARRWGRGRGRERERGRGRQGKSAAGRAAIGCPEPSLALDQLLTDASQSVFCRGSALSLFSPCRVARARACMHAQLA